MTFPERMHSLIIISLFHPFSFSTARPLHDRHNSIIVYFVADFVVIYLSALTKNTKHKTTHTKNQTLKTVSSRRIGKMPYLYLTQMPDKKLWLVKYLLKD